MGQMVYTTTVRNFTKEEVWEL